MVPRKQKTQSESHDDAVSVDSTIKVTENQSASASAEKAHKNGGWREIEARREKAALKASLADVWDEDFDLDEEILADLDHTAEYFTQQEDVEDEDFVDDDSDDSDEFYDDDEV